MDQDLLNYLEQRFSAIDRRFNEVDQRFRETGQQIQAFQEETTQRFERLETEVRAAWISIEDLRDQVKLVAEGVANNNERLDRHAEATSRRFDDLESLLHQSYEDLDSRVRKLEATG
jgi:DNA repair exonuclease SbcCD ATPase subunit